MRIILMAMVLQAAIIFGTVQMVEGFYKIELVLSCKNSGFYQLGEVVISCQLNPKKQIKHANKTV